MSNYRINGFDQIKAFYSMVFDSQFDIKPQHVSLYCFLINQNNRNNWVEWFKCPFDLAMAGACIGSKRTYYKCLDDLQTWKLIQYKKGVNEWKAPRIKIIKMEVQKSTTAIPQSEQLAEQLTEQLANQLTEQLTEQLPIHKYKLITNNLKLITYNIEEVVDFLQKKNLGDEKTPLSSPEDPKEVNQDLSMGFLQQSITKNLMAYFGFNEQVNFDKLRTCSQFVKVLSSQNRIEYFSDQFKAYQSYKEESKQIKHSFPRFLGTIENNFDDGGWNAENWVKKLEDIGGSSNVAGYDKEKLKEELTF